MYWENGHMDAGWGLFMVGGMLLVWGLTVFAIVWFVRTTRPPLPPAPPQAPVTAGAEQILAERLARGEIEPEDYQGRLTALKAST